MACNIVDEKKRRKFGDSGHSFDKALLKCFFVIMKCTVGAIRSRKYA
jgi:hypothetical protein